jgi:hypothetical protein
MRRLWPASEPAQSSYEQLRAAILGGGHPNTPAALRFERFGLAGLIAWPLRLREGEAEVQPTFTACISGIARPHWSPYRDPRLDDLMAAYQLLVNLGEAIEADLEAAG